RQLIAQKQPRIGQLRDDRIDVVVDERDGIGLVGVDGTDTDRLGRHRHAGFGVFATVHEVYVIGDLAYCRTAALWYSLNLGILAARLVDVVNYPHLGDQVKRAIIKTQIVGLRLHRCDIGAGQYIDGGVQLRLGGLGQRDMVGIFT